MTNVSPSVAEMVFKTGTESMAFRTDYRRRCHYYYEPENSCRLGELRPTDKTKVCLDCPFWSNLDVLYGDITGRVIQPTYEWWREEWVRSQIQYAKERMEDYVKLHSEPDPLVAVPAPQSTYKLTRMLGSSFPTYVGVMIAVTLVNILSITLYCFMVGIL